MTAPAPAPNAKPMPTAPAPSPRLTRDSCRPITSFSAVWQWLQAAFANFSKMNGSLWSASFAYYAFFALFPLLILAVTVAAGFINREQLLDYIFGTATRHTGYLPLSQADIEALRKTIDGVINSRASVGFFSLLGLLWSALGFFQALVGANNAAWGMEQPNWWRLPLKNLTMLGVLLSALLLGILAPSVLKAVLGYLTFSHWLVPTLLALANLLVPTLVLFYGFVLFYKLAPRQRAGATFTDVWLPALFVAAMLQLAQQLFAIYASNFAKFNAIYGTFGGVIALMLWIYLSGLIIVFGGCLCATRYLAAGDPAAGGEAKL